MFYNSLKKFFKKFPTLWRFLTWFKDCLLNLSRLKDVLMMMLLLNVWPKQAYRFSTRKMLPSKKNRASKKLKPIIPYDLLRTKSSNIPIMKEINIICRGSSFDLNDLKEINGPIFLIAHRSPLKVNNNGQVFYKHFQLIDHGAAKNYVYDTIDRKDHKKLFDFQTNKEFKKDNLTYVHSRKNEMEMFKKNGNNVLSINIYRMDKDGNCFPSREFWETSSHLSLIDHYQCKRISIVEKLYQPPDWAPTGSFLPSLCALSYFAEKINVYGWDTYLDLPAEKMSHWQLLFNMIKYKIDTRSWKAHFEHSLINFYYCHQFSKIPKFNIHGHLRHTGKHEKLARNIEKVLFQ